MCTVREQVLKEFSFQLPIELLRAIFEECLRLDLPVQILLEVNRQWRNVALETRSLWWRLLLSTDAIPDSLRAGSIHACASEGQATRILNRSGSITKLEVTFFLGLKEGETPTLDTKLEVTFVSADAILDSLTVGPIHAHGPEVQSIHMLITEFETTVFLAPTEPYRPGPGTSFLGIIVKPDATLRLVSALLGDLRYRTLSCLESTMVARVRHQISILYGKPQEALPLCLGADLGLLGTDAYPSSAQVGNFYDRPGMLINIIDRDGPSKTPKLLYLDNQAFILHVVTTTVRALRTTIQNESDSLNESLFSLPHKLGLFSFRCGFVATPAAHLNSAVELFIEFRPLCWIRFNSTSMDALMRLNLQRLDTTVVNYSQENYLAPTPPLGTLGLPTLKLLQTTALDPTHVPNRDTLLLSIPTVKRACADTMLDGRTRPHHLTLRGPLQDTHLSVVLRFLGEKLVSLGLGNLTPSSKFLG
jgi:hypothetical protein